MKRASLSMINDIVKKQNITFLKSNQLFGEEDEIFSPKKEEADKTKRANHRRLIRAHLDGKKKVENLIERIMMNGDKHLL